MKRVRLFLTLGLLSALALSAQSFDYGVAPDTYGVNDEMVHLVMAADLDPSTSLVEYGYFIAGRYSTNDGGFYAGLRLPAGSLVTRFEMDACDNSGSGEVRSFVVRCVSPFNGCLIVGQVSTGVTFSDGGACGTFPMAIGTPFVVDNETELYYISADNPGNNTSSTRINSVRVYYTLQISPPPLAATFADVPTGHPLFQFVEALAASGITAGCGGGNFCPNDPLTRGQMAVFLAKALGLHWAP